MSVQLNADEDPNSNGCRVERELEDAVSTCKDARDLRDV